MARVLLQVFSGLYDFVPHHLIRSIQFDLEMSAAVAANYMVAGYLPDFIPVHRDPSVWIFLQMGQIQGYGHG